MKVSELTEKLSLEVVAGRDGLDNEISGVYIGDLLSWVMGKAKQGCAWVTIMGNVNIIAVASLVDMSCVIICEGASFEPNTIAKADMEGIPLLSTDMTAYEVAVNISL